VPQGRRDKRLAQWRLSSSQAKQDSEEVVGHQASGKRQIDTLFNYFFFKLKYLTYFINSFSN
jgi:hypothetical protein